MEELKNRIINWMRTQVNNAGRSGVVFGMSGGIDSSVVAILSKIAFGSNCLGLIMPCNSDPKDMEYALLVAKKFNIKTEVIQLNSVFTSILSVIEPKIGAVPMKSNIITNIKPRLRMIVLYSIAQKHNYLVCGTGNKSELLTGYFTKYGDGGVDILPIGGLLKTQVIELAKNLEVPEVIIKRIPTAGLWQGQTDESELGMTYTELDRTIDLIEKKNISNDNPIILKVKKMMENSEHKRTTIPVFIP